MHALHGPAARRAASGAVLVVAVVLLLLASVLTLYAVNVGVFEQRSTGNDLRNKLVDEVAEAGLAQGFEYLIRQHKAMLKTPGLWERCAENDTKFPCGAITAGTFDHDGDPATAEVSRRGSMFRLKADTTLQIPGIDPELSKFMLPLPTASKIGALTNAGNVAYGVAPVMCFATRPASPAATGISCGSVGPGTTSVAIATFVSVAKIPGENASSTLVQTVGQYPKFGEDLLAKPPLTASGTAGVSGTLQIVTNPNAGGAGVPVSVWSRLDVDKTGTTNTCYADEFFRYPTGSATPTLYQGSIRCDKCRCDSNSAPRTLSYDSSGVNRCDAPTADCEGLDILDVEAGTDSETGYNVDGQEGANFNVRSDRKSFLDGFCEFPPDLFKFVFHVAAWEDTDGDCFAEAKLASVPYQNPDGGASALVGPDEAYLYKIADRIIPRTANAALVRAAQFGTTALLASSASSGVIWCQQQNAGDCDIASNVQVGTPAAPVVLILDGPVRIQGTVFGFVFIRETGAALRPATGGATAGACPPDCLLTMNAGAAVYGGIVVQGQMTSNGTSAVIHDSNVLRGIIEQAAPVYATLPGAWTDQHSY